MWALVAALFTTRPGRRLLPFRRRLFHPLSLRAARAGASHGPLYLHLLQFPVSMYPVAMPMPKITNGTAMPNRMDSAKGSCKGDFPSRSSLLCQNSSGSSSRVMNLRLEDDSARPRPSQVRVSSRLHRPRRAVPPTPTHRLPVLRPRRGSARSSDASWTVSFHPGTSPARGCAPVGSKTRAKRPPSPSPSRVFARGPDPLDHPQEPKGRKGLDRTSRSRGKRSRSTGRLHRCLSPEGEGGGPPPRGHGGSTSSCPPKGPSQNHHGTNEGKSTERGV